MITNVTNAERVGRRAEADRRRSAASDRVACYSGRPCRVASSIARLEEVERHLAVVRARAAGDGSRG